MCTLPSCPVAFLDPDPSPCSPSLVDNFLSTFHPAWAGLQMLTVECMDRLRFQLIHRHRSVAIHLRSCHDPLVSSAVNCFVFPAMIETVLNSIGHVDSIPRIVDSDASCCIIPCHEDFGHYYVISYVQITDLSSSNTVKGKGPYHLAGAGHPRERG